LGVDKKHLERIPVVYPTWYNNKKEIRDAQVVVFYDETELDRTDVLNLGLESNLHVVPWSRPREHTIEGTGRFFDPQRQLMLAGFVHVPPEHVRTKYWLKLDLDVVATDSSSWLPDAWMSAEPAIIGHAWGYTKPADQLDILDAWSDQIPEFCTPRLNAKRDPQANKVIFPRISSWCALFSTQFSEFAKKLAVRTGGQGYLPVPSQDGFHWYVAHRLRLPIVRANFKAYGWDVRKNFSTVKRMANDVQKAQN